MQTQMNAFSKRRKTGRGMILGLGLGMVLAGLGVLLPTVGESATAAATAPADDAREKHRQFLQLKKEYEELDPLSMEAMEKLKEIGALQTKPAAQFLAEALEGTGKRTHLAEQIIRALGVHGGPSAVQIVLTRGFEILPAKRYSVIGESLGKVTDPKALDWVLTKGWKKIPMLPADAQVEYLLVIEGTGDPRMTRVAEKLVGKPQVSPPGQVILLGIIANNRVASAGKKVARLAKIKNAEIQVAVLRCLLVLGPEKHSDVFMKSLRSNFWEVRVTACEIFKKTRQQELIPLIVPLLDDPTQEVKIAAVDALLHLGGDDVMDPLIAALGTTSGRVQDDIAEALVRLTGKDFGIVSTNWESWWTSNQGNVKIASIALDEYERVKKESEEAATGVNLYYGLRIISKYVTFIVDTSGSMREKYLVKDKGKSGGGTKKGKTDVAGRKKGDAKKKDYVEKQKIEVAREELTNALAKIPDGTQFNIIKFNTLYTAWKKELVKMDEDLRKESIQFAQDLVPAGETNVFDTVMTAIADPSVNTIYFLSDGMPTSGSITNPDEILAKVAEANRLRKVKIYTIGFHLNPDAEKLMRQLAEQNYGRFVKR